MPSRISSDLVQQQISHLKDEKASKAEETTEILRFKKDHFKVGKTKGTLGLRTARVLLGLIPSAKGKIQERIDKQTDAQRKEAVEELRTFLGRHRPELKTTTEQRSVGKKTLEERHVSLAQAHQYINPPSPITPSSTTRIADVIQAINDGAYSLENNEFDAATLKEHLRGFDKESLRKAFMLKGSFDSIPDHSARKAGRAAYFEKKVTEELSTFDRSTGDLEKLKEALTKNYKDSKFNTFKRELLSELDRQLSQPQQRDSAAIPQPSTVQAPAAQPSDSKSAELLNNVLQAGIEDIQGLLSTQSSIADLQALNDTLRADKTYYQQSSTFSHIANRIAELETKQAGGYAASVEDAKQLMTQVDAQTQAKQDGERVTPNTPFLSKHVRYAADSKHGHWVKATAVELPATESAPALRLHANKFRMAPGEPETMMMQAPKQQAIGDFWLAHALNGTKAVVDLTQASELGRKVNVYYPTQQGESKEYKSIDGRTLKVTLNSRKNAQEDRNLELNKYTVLDQSTGKSKTIHRIHFKGWEDMHGVDPAALDQVINITDKVAGDGLIAVHCSAGIGRTGTFVSARTAKHTLGGEKLSPEQVSSEVAKLAKIGRKNRNPRFIQKDTQFQTLMNYIGNQDKFAQTATPAAKPKPAPKPGKGTSNASSRPSKPRPSVPLNKPAKVASAQSTASKPLNASTLFDKFIEGGYEGKQWGVILSDIAQLRSREQLEHLQTLGEEFLQENPGTNTKAALEYMNEKIEEMKATTLGMRPESAVSYVNQPRIDTRSS